MSLDATETRVSLLARVEQGDVLEGITDETEGDTWLTDMDGSAPEKVTARMAEMEQAGWVEISNNQVVWQLTDFGRAVLRGSRS